MFNAKNAGMNYSSYKIKDVFCVIKKTFRDKILIAYLTLAHNLEALTTMHHLHHCRI